MEGEVGDGEIEEDGEEEGGEEEEEEEEEDGGEGGKLSWDGKGWSVGGPSFRMFSSFLVIVFLAVVDDVDEVGTNVAVAVVE